MEKEILNANFYEDEERLVLCEALDRILNKGVVIMGEITISVANIDLIYLNFKILLTSIETLNKKLIN